VSPPNNRHILQPQPSGPFAPRANLHLYLQPDTGC
jgi:hypothetical protein